MIARCEPAFDAPTVLSSRSDFTDNFDAENRAPSGHGGRAEGTVKTDQIEHLNFDIDEPADDLVALSKNSVLRRLWLLHLAHKTLAFDQALEWARKAEEFLGGSTISTDTRSVGHRQRPATSGTRDTVLQLIRDHPEGLSRSEILQALNLRGNKAAEASVSNALHALLKAERFGSPGTEVSRLLSITPPPVGLSAIRRQSESAIAQPGHWQS